MTDHIRDLFLHPHPTYSIAGAASVLGMDVREVQGWVEAGELEGVDTENGLVLPWSEVVSFAMDFWSQDVIEEALGEDAFPQTDEEPPWRSRRRWELVLDRSEGDWNERAGRRSRRVEL